MNYLSHQALAGRFAPPDAAPEFFVGNLLPDLLSMAGDGRLREPTVAAAPADEPLAEGVRLHHRTDQGFHSHPAFHAATAAATARLRDAPFSEAPRRLFFVAHVFVELALDAAVLRHSPGTAADLYAALMAVDKDAVAARAALWQGRPAEPMRLPELMRRFYEDRFLSDYARPEGLAAAMARVGRRAAVQNFSAPSDQDLLAALFVEFEAEAEAFRAALYEDAPGFIAPARAWYNTGDIPT